MAPPARICGHDPTLPIPRPRGTAAPPLVAALALAAFALPAQAHSWYEATCCSGRDCAPIPVEAVELNAAGDYLVTIEAGAHPLVSTTQSWVWPRTDVRPSQDGSWHGCVSFSKDAAGHQRLLCLYAPMSF